MSCCLFNIYTWIFNGHLKLKHVGNWTISPAQNLLLPHVSFGSYILAVAKAKSSSWFLFFLWYLYTREICKSCCWNCQRFSSSSLLLPWSKVALPLAWTVTVACPSASDFTQAILSRRNETSTPLKTKLHTKIFHCLLFLLRVKPAVLPLLIIFL